MKKIKHTVWHLILMIFYLEFVNSIWLLAGLAIFAGGLALYNFGQSIFVRVAVGLPMALTGVSLAIFKAYELILVLVKPARIKAICSFCRD